MGDGGGRDGLAVFDLTGRVALVTGGGGALGCDMARALAGAGARVAVMGRRPEPLEQAVAQLGGAERALAVVGDVTRPQEVSVAVQQVVAWGGRLDILLNAAGTHIIKPSDQLEPAEWQRVIDINLTGSFLCARAAAAVMREQGGGKIINIGSVMSRVGLPRRAAYAASKGAIVLLTRTLAQEWGPWGIQVNAIAPGFFRTRLNEHLFQDPAWVRHLEQRVALGRAGRPGDLGGAVIFLASPASDYVTGQVLYVDGGFSSGEPW